MPFRATEQDGTHPRPQLLRAPWTDLSGTWQFTVDDGRRGLDDGWAALTDVGDRSVFDRDIVVPYPPESPASGIGDTGPHAVFWYRRTLRLDDVGQHDAVRERGHRVVLRFGAVDHSARVWLDGVLLGTHEGGQTPFCFDVTAVLRAAGPGPDGGHVLVVRAHDDPRDVTQPRGKQDWHDEPHGIWYHRTSGIWQPVWCEVVPPVSVEHLAWTPDVPGARVQLTVTLREAPVSPVTAAVQLTLGNRVLAEHTVRVQGRHTSTSIAVPALLNGQERSALLWSPEHPQLVDATVQLLDTNQVPDQVLDEVSSYLGLRSVGVGGRAFLLNGLPCPVRSVLAQGYWPSSHLAAPDAAALRREAELVKDLGFNGVRVHQKVEDPRFLYWADRLGLLVWGETANAFAFTPDAVRLLTTEWLAVVHRDLSHPCIVTWVPVNESWGVPDIAVDPAQQAYATGLAALTRAVDPSRPVLSNDGWEHTDSDIWTVHDYADTGDALAARYGSAAAFEALHAPGAAGRPVRLPGGSDRGQPLMLTEFGGVRFTPGSLDADSWGYSTASDAADFERRLADLLGAVHSSPVLAGFCYTQLTDTRQEANGLLDEHRVPKLPIERLRHLIRGS